MIRNLLNVDILNARVPKKSQYLNHGSLKLPNDEMWRRVRLRIIECGLSCVGFNHLHGMED